MKSFLSSILIFSLAHSLCAQSRHYVNWAAAGANDGSSWADAFTDLQSALSAAQAGDEVWVAQGTYLPTSGTDRAVSFEPRSGVRLYGGFAGWEADLSQRDWQANATVLSGDIGAAGDSTDNSLTVVYLHQPDSLTVLDGFTVCFGVADYVDGALGARHRAVCGGGLYVEGGGWEAMANVRNCRFWRNTAQSFGGGVMVNGTNAAAVAPRFAGCAFEENRSLGSGGGCARFGGSWAERGREFDGCVFEKNSAKNNGGGLSYADSPGPNTVSLYGCAFKGNSAEKRGGGAQFVTGKAGKSGLCIRRCDFEGNMAIGGAAGDVFTNGNVFDGELEVDSCVFFKNMGLSPSSNSSVFITDQFGDVQTRVKFSNSTFNENISDASVISIGTADAESSFENTFFVDNIVSSLMFRLSTASNGTVRNTIFKSNKCAIIGEFNANANTAVELSNCIFEENIITSPYGDFSVGGGQDVVIRNCTYVFQDRPTGAIFVFLPGGAALALSNTFFTDSISYVFFSSGTGPKHLSHNSFGFIDCDNLHPNVTCGPGNLSGADPLFRDPAAGDYTLLPCSPLIDAGSDAAAAGIPTDIAGKPRIQGARVDIGAHEAPPFGLAAPPAVKPACGTASDGAVSLSLQDGCGPLSFSWQPPAGNGPELTGLPPGAYAYTATDAAGRSVTGTASVPAAPEPEPALAASDVACGAIAGGSLTATVAGGTAPFAYAWEPELAGQPQHSGLPAGAYLLTVTDANGCSGTASASLSLLGALTLSVGGTPIACHGAADAALLAEPLNGLAPFSWQWEGWPGTGPEASPLGPGQYSVTVTDALGCTSSFAFNPVTDPPPLSAVAEGLPQTQPSPPNGAAAVTSVSGGSPWPPPAQPYAYGWSEGSAQPAIGGLAAGTYTVTVTDSRGCTAVAEVTVGLMLSTGGGGQPAAFALWPCPAADWLAVALPPGDWELRLLDAGGRAVGKGRCAGGGAACPLDLRGLPSGAYVLEVWDGNERRGGRKILKK
jgi:hypothetical protein